MLGAHTETVSACADGGRTRTGNPISAITPPAAALTPVTTIASWKPWTGSRVVTPAPAITGSTATAISPAIRATALLTPLASPGVSRGDRPERRGRDRGHDQAHAGREHEDPGKYAGEVAVTGRRASQQDSPSPAISGPAVSSGRAPIFGIRPPTRAENSSRTTVVGVVAAPACSGE